MTMKVTPISPVLGARVTGICLTAQPSDQELAFINKAIADHLVLVFPDQDLTSKALRSFVSHFGPLFIHHADEGVLLSDGLPEVLEMRKEADGDRLFGGSDWHADVTFRKPEGYLSVLHARIVPPIGGDTAFSSNIAAFSGLSTAMQDLLRGLNAVHSYNGPGQPEHAEETATHSVVRAHPQTGREGLYINRMFATRFEGMTEAESRPLIGFLDQHMSSPQFTCRVSWRRNQVVIWDNRFTLHYPINDFSGYKRLLVRCTCLVS